MSDKLIVGSMKQNLLFTLILLFFAGFLWAQSLVVMPTLDNEALRIEELNRRAPGLAPAFAHPFMVDLNHLQYGEWTHYEGYKSVWQLTIVSAGAWSVNVGLTDVYFPPGSELFLWGNGSGEIFGPFGQEFNRDYRELWTPVIPGDEITLMLRLPPEEIENLSLVVSSVNHDFMNFRGVMSGACNLDVICGEANGWAIVDNYRDIIQSVAVISTGGFTFCTGFLVNNANNDCTPFFMTARHCGINSGNAGSLVTYWNYQNSFCRQPNSPASGAPGNGVLTDFNTGAVFRASYQPSDFTLVELSDPVSPTANAFFAGWNATSANPDTSIAIHHPNTDEKRISFDFDPGTTTNYLQSAVNPNGTHIRVGNWEIGTTEGGSSGSPLFDQNKRVVGQLHGGYASCSSNTDDWYGRFSVSWTGGNSPSTSLKAWLDPNDTGAMILDGRYATACEFGFDPQHIAVGVCVPDTLSIVTQVSDNFDTEVVLSVSGLPGGFTLLNFPATANGGDLISFSVVAGITVPAGLHAFTIVAGDGENTGTATVEINVSIITPVTPLPVSPVNLSIGVSTVVQFDWSAPPHATFYDFQLSETSGFSGNLLANLSGQTVTSHVMLLEPTTQYYWRVRSGNTCGTSDWSAVFTFTTGQTSCGVYTATDLPITIGSGPPNTIQSTINIAGEGNISSISVPNITGLHTWMSDLVFILQSPQGTQVTLMANVCGSSQNFNLGFSDDAPAVPLPCPPIGGGVYQPAGSLNDFIGQQSNGNWTLIVQDQAFLDGGQLQSWELELCYSIPDDFSVNSELTQVTPIPVICNVLESKEFEITLGSSYGQQSVLSVTLPGDVIPTVEFIPPVAAGGESVIAKFTNFHDMPSDYYSFILHIDDGEQTINVDCMVRFLESPGSTLQMLPENESSHDPGSVQFSWNVLNQWDYSLLEIAKYDDSFSNAIIVYPTTLATATIQIEETGYYKWRVRAQNECGISNSADERYFHITGTSTTETWPPGVLMFPNPAGHVLYIQSENVDVAGFQFSIVDVTGRSVSGKQMIKAGIVDISHLPPGWYILQLSNRDGTYQKTFVKSVVD